jgi:hypothetical protein
MPASVLKTIEPKLKPAGLTGLMVGRFKPVNKPNRSAGYGQTSRFGPRNLKPSKTP